MELQNTLNIASLTSQASFKNGILFVLSSHNGTTESGSIADGGSNEKEKWVRVPQLDNLLYL